MTPTVGSQTKPATRRALLAGALGGLGAVAASAIGRVSPVRAANGDPVLLGQTNSATAMTVVNATTVFPAIRAENSGGIGVVGAGGTVGVTGTGSTIGVQGSSDSGQGVRGLAGTGGTGVQGTSDGHHTSTAVKGRSVPEGVAVKAETQNGIAVWAQATGGYALAVEGRAVFSQRGRATFSAGQASRTITASLPFLTTSMVLATIQGNVAGTWVRGVSLSKTEPKFTIRLNKAAPKTLKVGWFIVN